MILTALSFVDEKREISGLLCTFLQKLEFGREYDKQLNFFVEARRAFANLDPVKVALVHAVCTLAVQQLQSGGKSQTAFLRACLAYCFITIPSIESEFDRLHLFVATGQVALLCSSLPQADEMFKAAINLTKEIPQMYYEDRESKSRSSNQAMINFLKYFISILVSVPGHPSNGPFYLLEALLKVIKSWEWEAKSTGKILVYNTVLALLAANSQRRLPYHWQDVESNDSLYGGTQKHLKDIQALIDSIITEIRSEITRLNDFIDGISRLAQAEAIIDTVYVTIEAAQMNPATTDFIISLLNPDLKNSGHAHFKKLRDYISFRSQTDDAFNVLNQKMINFCK